MENLNSKSLYIIGNGFDLLHGVESSYYDFREYIMSRNKSMNLEVGTYFNCENYWGDFEDKLASLSAKKVIGTVDNILDVHMSMYKDNANNITYDSYSAAIDLGTRVVEDLTVELPKQLEAWINSLTFKKERLEDLDKLIKKDAAFINFNYTEFLESNYNVEKDRILYIHGNRSDKSKDIVLGHGRNPRRIYGFSYDTKYKDNITSFEDLEGNSEKSLRNPIKLFAANYVSNRLREYFYAHSKKTEDIISDNIDFFNNLRFVEEVYVIGHSMSQVDHPYFRKIIEENRSFKKIKWKISYYGEEDKKRIEDGISKMGLDMEDVEFFKIKIPG